MTRAGTHSVAQAFTIPTRETGYPVWPGGSDTACNVTRRHRRAANLAWATFATSEYLHQSMSGSCPPPPAPETA